jgi:hypothetical protein
VDLALAAADDLDEADLVDLLELGADHVVGDVEELALRQVGGERERDDRLVGRVQAPDDGFLDVVRELALGGAHAIADLLLGVLDVGLERELGDDARDALLVDRGQALDAGQGGDLVFEGLGDERLDFLGTGARVGGGHRDDREGDVREEVDAQAREGLKPHGQHDQDDAGNEDGAADG